MRFSTIFFAFVVFITVNGGDATEETLVTEIINEILENLRPKAANIYVTIWDLCNYGTISEMSILNVDTFVIEKLEAPGPFSVDISNATVSLHNASATGMFNFVNVNFPDIGLSLNGAGNFSGYAEDIFLTLAIDVKLTGVKIAIEDISGLYLNIGEVHGAFDGIENPEKNNEIINTTLAPYLSKLLLDIAIKNKEKILFYINNLLSGL